MKYLISHSTSKLEYSSRKRGFSLIELMTVIFIVSLLGAVAIPAFKSIATAHGVSQGLYDISTVLEYGRTEAVTRQTYVWVVFQDASVGNQSVQSEIRVAAFASEDGTSNATASNLLSLTKVEHIQNAVLTKWSDLKSTTSSLLSNVTPSPTPVPVDVFGNTGGVSFPTPSLSATGNQFTVTFTPRGEAMLAAAPAAYTPYNSWIDVSFRQVHGYFATADSNPVADASSVDDAAVVIDGSTGTLQRIQLK